MSAQREMTLQEWVDKLPGIHSAHKEFDSLQATIAQQAERIEGLVYAIESQRLAMLDLSEKYLKQSARIAQVETQRDNYFAINIELNQDVSNQCEQLFKQSAEIERLTSECDTGQRRAEMAQRLHEDHYSTIAQQAERIAEMEAEAAENCRIIGMSGEREARHLAVITEQAALIEKCSEFLEFLWREVGMNDFAAEKLEELTEAIAAQKGGAA